MSGLEEQIAELEVELTKTPYNKATSKHIGRIKAKIAKLRDEAVFRAMKSGGGGEGYSVKKSGDATAVLVGFPSTGKSTLLNKLTGTESAVAAYAFTTLTVVPGALEHKGAKIELLDIPGLIAGAAMGKGRGKEVIGVVRSADIIIILVDVFNGNTSTSSSKSSTMRASGSTCQSPISPSRRPRWAVSVSRRSGHSTSISRTCGRSSQKQDDERRNPDPRQRDPGRPHRCGSGKPCLRACVHRGEQG